MNSSMCKNQIMEHNPWMAMPTIGFWWIVTFHYEERTLFVNLPQVKKMYYESFNLINKEFKLRKGRGVDREKFKKQKGGKCKLPTPHTFYDQPGPTALKG